MIKVENVSKRYHTRNGWRTVLRDINFNLERGSKIGILGRNGAGKSTLIRLISGVEAPTSGEIIRDMSISWPLAFSGAFQGGLTGMDNLRFISRLYNANINYVKSFTEEFTELGDYLYEPVKRYSAGMKARLAFALSLSIEFDCYLIDEVIAVGDSRFAAKCKHELFEKRKDRSIILVSHSPSAVRQYCDNAVVLEDGIMKNFPNIDAAYHYYNQEQLADFLSKDGDLKQLLMDKQFMFSRINGEYARVLRLNSDGKISSLTGRDYANEATWDVIDNTLIFKHKNGNITSSYFQLGQNKQGMIDATGYYHNDKHIIFRLVEQEE